MELFGNPNDTSLFTVSLSAEIGGKLGRFASSSVSIFSDFLFRLTTFSAGGSAAPVCLSLISSFESSLEHENVLFASLEFRAVEDFEDMASAILLWHGKGPK